MKKAPVIAALLLLLVFCIAQPVLAQKKVTAPLGVWPELQVSYGVGDAGLLFFQNQYRINTDSRFNDFRERGFLSNFEQIRFSLGYEHALNEHWRGGAVGRYAAENYPSTSYYSLFLRHTSTVKSFYFNKQLTTEYVVQEDQEAMGHMLLMAEVGKQLKVKQQTITPSICYEAALFYQFAKETTTTDERFVDRTRLRLNLTWEASPKVFISTYFLRQTEFYFVEVPPVYDEDDVLVANGYRTKRNRITPVIGLAIKYNINSTVTPANFSY